MGRSLWRIGAALMLYSIALVCGETYTECEDPSVFNSFVASQSDCAKYVYCNGEESFVGECLGDNYFDEQEGNCESPELVSCKLLPESLVTVDGADDMSDATAVNGTDDLPDNGTALLETVTESANSSTANGSEVDAANTVAYIYTTEAPSSIKVTTSAYTERCPLENDAGDTVLRLADETSCGAYYFCYKGVAIRMLCSPQLYFNAQSSRCEPKERVQCTLSRPLFRECKRGINGYMPHPQNCDYYYYCANGFRMIFQCPSNFAWDYERRTCVQRAYANCFSISILRHMLAI